MVTANESSIMDVWSHSLGTAEQRGDLGADCRGNVQKKSKKTVLWFRF